MTIEANDGKPIVIGTEFNHRLEASIKAVVGDRAESGTGTRPDFCGRP